MNETMGPLKATLTFQCPACRKDSMYENPSLYTWSKIGKTKKHCSHCNTDLQPEPGFYFGAAYVSWGLTVATWVAVLVALKTFALIGWIEFAFLTHPITFLITGIITSLVIFPYMFRLSRSIWSHWFIPFQEEVEEEA
jgi:hypothetical protein